MLNQWSFALLSNSYFMVQTHNILSLSVGNALEGWLLFMLIYKAAPSHSHKKKYWQWPLNKFSVIQPQVLKTSLQIIHSRTYFKM